MKKILSVIAITSLALALGFGIAMVKELADPPIGGLSTDGQLADPPIGGLEPTSITE